MSSSIYENVHMDDKLPMRIVHLDSTDKNAPYAHLLGPIDINTVHFIPPHWHRSIEMTYIKKGSMKLRLGNDHTIYHEGEFLFINSGDIHEISNIPGQATEVVCFIISYEYCRSLDPQFDHMCFDIKKTPRSYPDLKTLFEKILLDYYGDDDLKHLLIRSNLDLVMYRLFQDFQMKPTDGSQVQELMKIQQVHKTVLEYIHDHYRDPLNLEDLATHFQMSREHFARQFKEAFGRTFLEYLIDYRIFKAFEDIVNTKITIEHISQIHGFPSSKGMIIQFKKRYHTTPNDYRKNMNISIIDHKNEELLMVMRNNINK